jgi:hypothetical protein
LNILINQLIVRSHLVRENCKRATKSITE